MKRKLATTAVSVALALVLLSAAPAPVQDGKIVAKIDGVAITLEELEQSLSSEIQKLERQRHQLLENGIDQLVDKRLIEAAAEAKGLTAVALMDQEIAENTKPVEDADIDAWYEQNKGRVRGDKAQVTPQIRSFLEQQQTLQVRTGLVERLRSQHKIEVLFEPLRLAFETDQATLLGPADAPIKIVEFSDFQCPACKGFNPTLDQVKGHYGDKIQVVFRQFPLRSIHPQAQKAAEAALCGRDQSKFWEFHDAMFANQGQLEVAKLKERARTLGLDGETFDQCLDSSKYAAIVQADLDRGASAGVTGTPAVFVNGRPVSPGRVPSYEMLSEIIDQELARKSSD